MELVGRNTLLTHPNLLEQRMEIVSGRQWYLAGIQYQCFFFYCSLVVLLLLFTYGIHFPFSIATTLVNKFI